jgi:hypothetical protein
MTGAGVIYLPLSEESATETAVMRIRAASSRAKFKKYASLRPSSRMLGVAASKDGLYSMTLFSCYR